MENILGEKLELGTALVEASASGSWMPARYWYAQPMKSPNMM